MADLNEKQIAKKRQKIEVALDQGLLKGDLDNVLRKFSLYDNLNKQTIVRYISKPFLTLLELLRGNYSEQEILCKLKIADVFLACLIEKAWWRGDIKREYFHYSDEDSFSHDSHTFKCFENIDYIFFDISYAAQTDASIVDLPHDSDRKPDFIRILNDNDFIVLQLFYKIGQEISEVNSCTPEIEERTRQFNNLRIILQGR